MKDRSASETSEHKAVGIWIRVSTEDQAQGESPEHHEKRASLYAESKNWNVKEVYHLEAVSGKSVIGHPECQRMLRDIRNAHITGLIFSKLARLARNTRELLEISDIFRQHSADLISLQEAIDTSTPAGRLFYTLNSAMAEWEREEISSRVAASVPIRAKLGKSLGGAAPYGYQWVDRKLVLDPKEVPIRKLIYEWFKEHRRKKTVARLLNQAGHRTRNGSKFSDTTVSRLIQDPIAKGVRRSNYTKSLGEKKHWKLKPQDEWVLIDVPAIVSEELWNECNAILEDRRKSFKKPAKPAVHLFSGLTFCTCGSKMYVPSNMPKYRCSKCRSNIPIEDLETVFHEQLKNYAFSPKQIVQYMEGADQTIKEKEQLLNVLQEEQRKVTQDMDRLYELYLAGEIPKEGFGKKYQPYDERLKQLSDQIPELQGEIDFLKIRILSSDQILEEAKDLYSRWNDLLQDEKRKVVENITEKIVIGKEEVEITLLYLPSSENVANSQRNLRGSSLQPA